VRGVATSTATRPVTKLPTTPLRAASGADPGDARTELKNLGKVQPDHEDEPRREGNEGRRLELEAPSELAAGGAKALKHTPDNGHPENNAGGVG